MLNLFESHRDRGAQFDTRPLTPAYTPAPRKELPARVKTILGFKALGCLLTMGLSVIVLLAWSDPADRPVGMSQAMAHHIAMMAAAGSALSMLELFGVAGTWSFKRWGVYILTGFSMMNFVVRMHSGDAFGACVSIATTLITAFVIASRWEDFE